MSLASIIILFILPLMKPHRLAMQHGQEQVNFLYVKGIVNKRLYKTEISLATVYQLLLQYVL